MPQIIFQIFQRTICKEGVRKKNNLRTLENDRRKYRPLSWQRDTFSTTMEPILQNRIPQLSTHMELIGRPKVTNVVAC